MRSLRHADRRGKGAVHGVLDQEFRHDLPGIARRGVGVVRPVDLDHLGPGHDLLGLGRVDEGPHHVDVPIEHVVLGILVGAVHALLGEEHGDLRPGQAADVRMQVDRPADLVLDQIQGLPGRPQLFARDRDAPDPLRRALHQPVDVALPGRADDHHVVRPVPGGHPHPAQVVLEPPRSDLRGDGALRLRVDLAEVPRGRQGNASLQRLRDLVVWERPDLRPRRERVAPMPATAARPVMLEIGQDGPGCPACHLAAGARPLTSTASSQPCPWANMRPASRNGHSLGFARNARPWPPRPCRAGSAPRTGRRWRRPQATRNPSAGGPTVRSTGWCGCGPIPPEGPPVLRASCQNRSCSS